MLTKPGLVPGCPGFFLIAAIKCRQPKQLMGERFCVVFLFPCLQFNVQCLMVRKSKVHKLEVTLFYIHNQQQSNECVSALRLFTTLSKFDHIL